MTSSTIAIVGAGPQLGLAIARAFGRKGHNVALIARNAARLERDVTALQEEGFTAASFPADVLDRAALGTALHDAATRFGGIDILEYSPVGGVADSRLTTPSTTTVADAQEQIEFQLFGAIAATQAVLPAMREAGAGALLFTTGAGSINPVPFIANVNAAAAALRNWVINLHAELAGSGVYAAHVALDVSINGAVPDYPAASADEIASSYVALHESRDGAEQVITASGHA